MANWRKSVCLSAWARGDTHSIRADGESEERFVVHLDPETGLPRLLEAMRYKGAASEAKTLWLDQTLAWGSLSWPFRAGLRTRFSGRATAHRSPYSSSPRAEDDKK